MPRVNVSNVVGLGFLLPRWHHRRLRRQEATVVGRREDEAVGCLYGGGQGLFVMGKDSLHLQGLLPQFLGELPKLANRKVTGP